MSKKYQENPVNFDDFKKYLIYEKEEIVNIYFGSSHYFFYDTCSIQHHSNSDNRRYIIEYLKNKNATIILTRTVLMELCPNSYEVHQNQIRYFKELSEVGLQILLFNEESILDCLRMFFSQPTEYFNKILGHAIREVSKYKAKTYDILNNYLKRSDATKIVGNDPQEEELFSMFFKAARASKEQGDSLAEELMFICIIVLTSIPPRSRYIFFSNDLAARDKVIKLSDYIAKHHNQKEPYQLTTAAMIDKMHHDNILTDQNKMLEIMNKTYGSGRARIYYIGEYDIKVESNSFECAEIISKLVNENQFKILY